MAKLENAVDLKFTVLRLIGSSPIRCTTYVEVVWISVKRKPNVDYHNQSGYIE